MALQAGDVVGSYELIAPLGSGGMGDVYRARDLRLGRMVAIKFVSPHQYGNPGAEARLDREARLASSLNHPAIVSVFDVGRHDGQPYVVMELIEGRSLAARIADGRLPIREAVEIGMHVADGLAAAHDAGVIHRDLKPHNIMLTAEGRPKVVDFGLSKVSLSPESGNSETVQGAALTDRHAVLGTAGYMAPEQVLSRAVDGRADQFALGAITYEMLSGRRAFHRESAVQTMSSVLEDEPTPLGKIRPDVPAGIVSIVARCLSKRPEGRYASTRDLAHDLHDAYEQILLDSKSGSSIRRPPTGARRWPAVVATTLALLVAGVLAWQRLPWRADGTASQPSRMRHIAVLPLANVTKDAADQVFADGLVETLTSGLTQLERYSAALRVVPAVEVRTGRIESVRDARQAFGVTLAISGSIQRLASGTRITLNLVDAERLVQLGARTIDVTAGREVLTQDTVAGAATALLALELEPEARRAMTAGGTSSAEAYELYVTGRGHLYRFDRGVEHIDLAIEALGRAIAVDQRYASAHSALAEAYLRKYDAVREPALMDRAAAQCEEALAIDSRLAPVHVTMAMVARGRGRYEEAVVMAQRAIELDPVSSDAYRELGRAREALNRHAEAEATYKQAVEARPDDWLAYNALGGFYYGRGRLPEAEAAYQRVVELTPDNTRGYNNLGAVYFRMQRDSDGVAMFERSAAIRPTFSATSNLGTYYFTRARYSDAARAFERAVTLQPTDRRVWRNFAAALHWAPGERDKARPAFAKAVELGEVDRKVNPRQPELLAELADSYAMLGSRTEALAAIAAVERLGGGGANEAYLITTALEQLGDRTAALGWLGQALAKKYPLTTIERSPSLAELRKDARYRTLVDRMAKP